MSLTPPVAHVPKERRAGPSVIYMQMDGHWLSRSNHATVKTSPMTFAVGGQQYIALAVGSTIMAFGL